MKLREKLQINAKLLTLNFNTTEEKCDFIDQVKTDVGKHAFSQPVFIMGELIETNFKKSKNYFYELRNILKLNSHSNKFHGSLYEKQLVHDFIQLNSTCLAIQSIFPFFLRFPEFVGHFSHTCFSNICSNSPSFFNPKFYFVKRIVDIIKTR